MFTTFDIKNFPNIKIYISGTLDNDDDFYYFVNKWNSFNALKTPFSYLIDTKDCGYVTPKYCIYTAMFLRKLKKDINNQFLMSSTIIVYNYYVYQLFKFVFSIESPIAPVTILLYNNNLLVKTKIFEP